MNNNTDLHRVDGRAVLIGPNCPDCQREETITFFCPRCGEEWDVLGKFVWNWQGKGHHHQEYDPQWNQVVHDHTMSHTPPSIIIPKSMSGGPWDERTWTG